MSSTSALQQRPSPPAPASAGRGPAIAGLARPLLRRWWPAAAEIALTLGISAVSTVLAVTIHDSPIARAGQVSGLAALQFRMALCALPLLAVMAWAALRATGDVRKLVVRLSAAAAAGLIGGFLGGGQMFTLRGTPWGLAGEMGDNARLIEWTQEVVKTGHFDNIYPPGIPHMAAFVAQHFENGNAAMAFKPLFVAMVAFTPGLVYVGWRMVLRPLPALGVAVFGALNQFLPYKPYEGLTLMLLVAVIAKLVMWLRSSPQYSWKGAFWRGAVVGVMIATIFIVYSGWHVWSFPGVAVMLVIMFPWRRAGRTGRLRGATYLGGTIVGFLPIGGVYLHEMLGATGTKDTWCTWVTQTDPGYIGQIALSGHQLQAPGIYPGPGEIAGLGVFALLTMATLGFAIAFGLRKAPVAATVACFGSAWMTRFYIAHNMERDGAVQLFPRTTNEIQFTLIVLAVVACVLGAERIRALAATVVRLAETRKVAVPRLRPAQFGAMGAIVALLLVGGMGSSWLTDHYLAAPPGDGTTGNLAWTSQHLAGPDGTCPVFAHGVCTEAKKLQPFPTEPTKPLVCQDPYRAYHTPPATKP